MTTQKGPLDGIWEVTIDDPPPGERLPMDLEILRVVQDYKIISGKSGHNMLLHPVLGVRWGEFDIIGGGLDFCFVYKDGTILDFVKLQPDGTLYGKYYKWDTRQQRQIRQGTFKMRRIS